MKSALVYPSVADCQRDSSAGIPQVILNLAKHLPEFGWQLTDDPRQAALIWSNAGSMPQRITGLPLVAGIHGLYPTGLAGYPTQNWHLEINRRVIDDLRHADNVHVPSEWVADILRRDMHLAPDVIQWGVNLEDWHHAGESDSYILWNKNRTEGVCTPEWINRLARRFPNLDFISTFGDELPNLRLTGRLPFEAMRPIVQRANVYLATTKETGDIGSREALAAGVPVLGFRQGALVDIVQHGYNGFLAEVGDFEGLAQGLLWIKEHRQALSQNAKHSALSFTWQHTAQALARLFDATLDQPLAYKYDASIVIPCYNYQDFVGEAIESALNQQTGYRYEVIVVNDGSTDGSLEIIKRYADRIKILDQKNSGVAYARNNGIALAESPFVACLDADDRMTPEWLDLTLTPMKANASLGITYTGLKIMGSDHTNGFPMPFEFDMQAKRENRISSLCLIRKAAWQRAGGFRQYMRPAEDADLWLRITALGYGARKVSDKPCFEYRLHPKSASAIVRTGQISDPFRRTDIGYAIKSFAIEAKNYPVRNYDQPMVSVIIPVGKGHEEYVKQALDSVEGQSEWNWEAIVINDTGSPLCLDAYPYARIINTTGQKGASQARNLGLDQALGRYVVFLDADDFLHPEFLTKALAKARLTGRYVYTDWQMLTKDGQLDYHRCPDFAPDLIFQIGYFHPITALIPAKAARAIKFDHALTAWEDVDYYMRLIISGECGVRIPEALMTYRYNTGSLREWGAARAKALKDILVSRYAPYMTGDKKIMCMCDNVVEPKAADLLSDQDLVRIQYITNTRGKHEVRGRKTRKFYGRYQKDDVFYVQKEDADAAKELFKIVEIKQAENPHSTIIPNEVLEHA